MNKDIVDAINIAVARHRLSGRCLGVNLCNGIAVKFFVKSAIIFTSFNPRLYISNRIKNEIKMMLDEFGYETSFGVLLSKKHYSNPYKN